MRTLIKNKQSLYLVRYKGEENTKDSGGNYTGEKTITYYPKKLIKANISGARGSSQSEVFGTEINYDKTLVFAKKDFKELGIDENSVFFVDKKPQYDGTNPLYDYRVERIAETLNEVVVAITKVRK